MLGKGLNFQGNCQTTAMGIMPFKDIGRALDLACGLDLPFWPQLPNVNYYEDMYVQTSQHFPGISIDMQEHKVNFNTQRFIEGISDYSEKLSDPATFKLSNEYSVVYHRFLALDLEKYTAIRGQLTGPVSFGFRVVDENQRPIIYNDEVRALLYDFIARKANAQYRELKIKNDNAFVWLDEPGLGWVFSGLSGYSDTLAHEEFKQFWEEIESPRALHLCANVNLPYLLSMGIDLLSFDAYQIQLMPKGYAAAVADFINKGGVIAWGIVPTDADSLNMETPEKLAARLTEYWNVVSQNAGVGMRQLARQALIAPSRCALKNAGLTGGVEDTIAHLNPGITGITAEEELVTIAFGYLKEVSDISSDKFSLYSRNDNLIMPSDTACPQRHT